MNETYNLSDLFMMIENALTGICILEYEEEQIKPVYVNDGFYRMMGYKRDDKTTYLAKFMQSIIPDDIPAFKQGIYNICEDNGAVDFEFRTVTPTGGLRWLHTRANLFSKVGNKYTAVVVVLDATERKNYEEELRLQAERLHILSETQNEQIIDYNAIADVMTIRYYDKDGIFKETIFGNYFYDFKNDTIYPNDIEKFVSVLKNSLKAPIRDSFEFRSRRFTPDYEWYQMDISSIAGAEGYVTRIVGRSINIDKRKQRELSQEEAAGTDSKTGLYTMETASRLIGQELLDSKQLGDEKIDAMFLLDLDNFQKINDFFGQQRGDQVIHNVSDKLSAILKGQDIIGHIAGDEFILFVKNISSISDAEKMAENICREIDSDVEYGDKKIKISVSIGISLYPFNGTTFEELFDKASKALYSVKSNGKNSYRLYDAVSVLTKYSLNNSEQPENLGDNIENLAFQILYQDNTDEVIIRSFLELITNYFKFTGSYVFMDSDDSSIDTRNLRYSADGYEYGLENKIQRLIKADMICRIYDQYQKLTLLHNYDDLQPAVVQYMDEHNIKEMLFFPLTVSDVFKGAVIFENCTAKELIIGESMMEDIRSLMRIMQMYILGLGKNNRIQNSISQLELLDNLDSYAYVIDASNYHLNFMNKKVQQDTPDLRLGDLCYKVLRNQQNPCADCPMRAMEITEPHAKNSSESFNYSLRKWTKNLYSWVDYRNGQGKCLMLSIDINEFFESK